MKHIVKQIPDPDEAGAWEGLIAPKPERLDEGAYIYRFASSVPPPGRISAAVPGYHASAWWIRREDFDQLVERASRAGTDLGQKARWDLAVLHKWGNRMDVVVEARVSDRLWAWTGLAKTQQELTPNGKIIQMFGNPQIRQLYVCGIVTESGFLTPYGRNALALTGAKIIPGSLLSS